MNSILELKDHPEILRVIRFASPKYRKHKCILVVATTVSLDGTYWSGGSVSSYTAVNMETGACRTMAAVNPPQFGGPKQSPNVELPEGAAIVKLGFFCGKPSTATVFVNPANVAKLLPEVVL